MSVQPGLCRTLLEISKTDFLMTRLIFHFYSLSFVGELFMVQCEWSEISPAANQYLAIVGGGKACATENCSSKTSVFGPWVSGGNTKR